MCCASLVFKDDRRLMVFAWMSDLMGPEMTDEFYPRQESPPTCRTKHEKIQLLRYWLLWFSRVYAFALR